MSDTYTPRTMIKRRKGRVIGPGKAEVISLIVIRYLPHFFRLETELLIDWISQTGAHYLVQIISGRLSAGYRVNIKNTYVTVPFSS